MFLRSDFAPFHMHLKAWMFTQKDETFLRCLAGMAPTKMSQMMRTGSKPSGLRMVGTVAVILVSSCLS